MAAKKETRPEKVKREKDALDCLDDIVRYARDGFASIDPDDLDVRLRWYGLYTQRPQEDGYFMLRVKIPNGVLTTEQLAAIGRISIKYAQNTGDLTTRQGIQFHFVRIENVPAIFAELAEVGLTTSGACGDISRNVTGCPLAGVDAREVLDAEATSRAIHEFFLGNREFSNLPRKFKITVSACVDYCTGHEINDLSLVGVRREDGTPAYDVWVGGGLGARERFADRLGVYVDADEAVEVAAAVCGIFRDHGNRGSRSLARLKFLLADWGPQRFLGELETRLGRNLERGPAPTVPARGNRAHIGVFPQKDGRFYIGGASERGKFHGSQILEVARLVAAAGGEVRLTPTQNLIATNISAIAVKGVAEGLAAAGFEPNASVFRTGTLACTGKRFCKLALTETKERASEVIAHLERELPHFTEPFRISVTGCPNSCAHYQVCDIGFVGDFLKDGDEKTEAYRVYLGGRLGNDASFGRELDRKVPAGEIRFLAERLVRGYLRERRRDDDSFQSFLASKATAELESIAFGNVSKQLTEVAI